mmetsp:Transcript_17153/g.36849  ORF Transcript_17153/g.36849 Transcript_17153/m.36849 type:complete len:450 (+) Transcript_17153:267-1616(+)
MMMSRNGGGGGKYETNQYQTMQKLLLVQQKKELLRLKHRNAVSLGGGDSDRIRVATKEGEVHTAFEGNWTGLRNLLLDPICVLLVFWPVGFLAYRNSWGDGATFAFNFVAMIPLAKLLGDATEELAAGLKSDVIGGLLNATFGNAVEMILTVQTLRAGELDVVKGTLLGSVLSNLLLVLGMSFFAGGLMPVKGQVRGKEQSFSKEAALTNMTMLFLASSTFALPTVLFSSDIMERYSPEEKEVVTLKVSRWCSLYILSAYIAFLLFQLFTHVDVFKGEDGDDEEGGASITPLFATGMLFVTTCLVACSSEWLVDSIDGLVDDWGISKAFIGIILLPIVGNACEHVGAIRMAISEKVDITIGIAVGSSTQVALFVVPFSVVMGWFLTQPMDLAFGAMDTTVMVFAVLIAFSIISDGSSNWLEGFMLMVAYAVVATLFWFVPTPPLSGETQ